MIKINNIQDVNNSQVDKLIKENEIEANIAISKILLVISGLYILIGLLNIASGVMMEIIPTKDYSDENQNLFLYVKNIDI